VVLRGYQNDVVVEEFHRLVAGGARSVLVTAPTGSGKMGIASARSWRRSSPPGSPSCWGRRRRD
jgi:hypothetical protein